MQISKWVTLGVGMVCLMIVAAVLNAQHLYYMAAILLTLPAVSYGMGWYALRGLTFSRELSLTAWAGEEGRVVYTIYNATSVARFFLSIHEPFPNWIEPLDPEPPLFNVGGNRSGLSPTAVSHRIRYHKRGVFALHFFDVTAIDPLGVFAFTRRIQCEGELVVFPLPHSVRSLVLSGSERYGWQEFTAAALRGGSVDPDGVREYVPGDPLRRIHWRQTARTGKLAVIEFEEPQAVNLILALDLQRGTDVGQGAETTLETAVGLAASLAQEAIQSGAGARLLIPEDLIQQEGAADSLIAAGGAGRGQEHLLRILDALARVEAVSAHSVSRLVTEKLGYLPPGTTLLVITSRPDSLLADALSPFISARAQVGVVYIDPNSFPGKSGRVSEASRERFFGELMAIQARPFVLSHSAQEELHPEAIVNATYRSIE